MILPYVTCGHFAPGSSSETCFKDGVSKIHDIKTKSSKISSSKSVKNGTKSTKVSWYKKCFVWLNTFQHVMIHILLSVTDFPNHGPQNSAAPRASGNHTIYCCWQIWRVAIRWYAGIDWWQAEATRCLLECLLAHWCMTVSARLAAHGPTTTITDF